MTRRSRRPPRPARQPAREQSERGAWLPSQSGPSFYGPLLETGPATDRRRDRARARAPRQHPSPARTESVSGLDRQPGQAGDVATENGFLLRLAEPDLLQVGDRGADIAGPALGVERAVGAEQDVVGAVEIDAAAQRVRGPEHGRVAVHLAEILDRPPRQRVALDVGPLPGRGARAQLVPPGADPAGEMGHHAAAVVDQQLEIWVPLQHAGEDDPGHEGRQVVLPAEGPPDL